MAKGVYYGIRLVFRPADIYALLGIGDLLSELRAFDHFVARVQSDPAARALIDERYAPGFPSVDELKRYPEGSLGRRLAEQMERFALGFYPKRVLRPTDAGIYLRERQREIHDLLHTLLGQGIELPEEVHVNAFMMAQCGAPVSILVVCGSILRTLFFKPAELGEMLSQAQAGYARGLAARNLFGIRWEDQLALPLEDARTLLALQ